MPTAGASTKANTLWALAADITQLLLTTLSFIWLSRFLGAGQFGIYGSIMAYSTFASIVAYMGTQQLLMADLAAGVPFQEVWARLVTTVVLGGTLAAGVLVCLSGVLIPELTRSSVALIGFSQVVLVGLVEFGMVAAQAHRLLWVGLALRATSQAIRLVGVAVFVATGTPTVDGWAWVATGVWSIAALASLACVAIVFRATPRFRPPSVTELRRGSSYAIGMGTASGLADIDKPMLLRIAGDESAGLYTAGYRLASFGLAPISAVVRATDYDFFEKGSTNRAHALRLARKLTGVAAVYGVAAGGVLVFSSFFVEDVLGSDYKTTGSVLRWLAPLAFLKGLQVFPANALTGSGHQKVRNQVVAIALLVNVTLNAMLIPAYTWRGAVAATLSTEIGVGVALWVLLLRAAAPDLDPSSQQASVG